MSVIEFLAYLAWNECVGLGGERETYWRRILTCGGTPRGTIRVEWLPPAAPGVDAKWEIELYGLVRTGQ